MPFFIFVFQHSTFASNYVYNVDRRYLSMSVLNKQTIKVWWVGK